MRHHDIGKSLLKLFIIPVIHAKMFKHTTKQPKSYFILRITLSEPSFRVSKKHHDAKVMVIGSSGSPQHLLEFTHGQPFYTHGKRLKYHLGCGKIHACRKCRGCHDHWQLSPAELLFHFFSFRIG